MTIGSDSRRQSETLRAELRALRGALTLLHAILADTPISRDEHTAVLVGEGGLIVSGGWPTPTSTVAI